MPKPVLTLLLILLVALAGCGPVADDQPLEREFKGRAADPTS
jgi:hypothetical protein